MEELWYRELGFFNNPLSMKPAAFHDELFGHEKTIEKLEQDVAQGSIWFVEGAYGSGKTSLLKRLIRKFGGKKKVIYYSCNISNDVVDYDLLLRNRYGLFGRIFGLKAKNMILLLDEAQYMTINDQEKVIEYHELENFKSVVFVGSKLKGINITKELKSLLAENIINLGEITGEDAVRLVRKRIGKLKIISDANIKEIFKKSDKNPRKLLENLEDVLRITVEHGEEEVTDELIKKVF